MGIQSVRRVSSVALRVARFAGRDHLLVIISCVWAQVGRSACASRSNSSSDGLLGMNFRPFM